MIPYIQIQQFSLALSGSRTKAASLLSTFNSVGNSCSLFQCLKYKPETYSSMLKSEGIRKTMVPSKWPLVLFMYLKSEREEKQASIGFGLTLK